MTEASQPETLGFQAEARQLLHLMIHSLYSNKEIFLRELISNASDAADKLRFEALNAPELFEDDPDLRIRVDFDEKASTVSITDNGIGMSRQEVIDNLGTIAKSGTAQFLEALSGDQKRDAHLIGQFGVGFYSAFIVADRVQVETRRAGLGADEGVRWTCAGEAEYQLETIEKADRGTRITLHLKEGESEFANNWRLRSIIKKYSDHIAVPIQMLKQTAGDEESGDKEPETPEWETVNAATALWALPKKDVSDEEYKAFYQHVSHDFVDPLAWSHNKVEGKLEYTSLLYIPSHAPFDLYQREAPRGLKLYVQRTFIMDDAEQFLPLYLRFVKGVVDSNDLPLNVSREILQKSPAVDSIRSALSKRVLDLLESIAKDKPEEYAKFWEQFGPVLKEGPAEDFANREKIAALLRFSSTSEGSPKQGVCLADYIGRMKEGQGKIYYLIGDNETAVANSPYLEIFRKHGVEVLLLTDRIDEWLMSHLREFDGKPFQDISRGELDLGDIAKDGESAPEEENKDDESLTRSIKELLGDKVEAVRTTNRLTESPACLVLGEQDVGVQMRRILEAAGQPIPQSKPTLEVNPAHPLVMRLRDGDDANAKDLAHLLYDQAVLSAGDQLEDPALFVKRLNHLLLEQP